MKDIVEALKTLGTEGKVKVDNVIYDEIGDILYDLGVNYTVKEGKDCSIIYMD